MWIFFATRFSICMESLHRQVQSGFKRLQAVALQHHPSQGVRRTLRQPGCSGGHPTRQQQPTLSSESLVQPGKSLTRSPVHKTIPPSVDVAERVDTEGGVKLGFRVWGLGRTSWGLGFGFKVEGLGFVWLGKSETSKRFNIRAGARK